MKTCVCCGTDRVEIPDSDGLDWCRECWKIATATTTIRAAGTPDPARLDDLVDTLRSDGDKP